MVGSNISGSARGAVVLSLAAVALMAPAATAVASARPAQSVKPAVVCAVTKASTVSPLCHW